VIFLLRVVVPYRACTSLTFPFRLIEVETLPSASLSLPAFIGNMASSDFLQGLSPDFDNVRLYQKLQQLWPIDPIRSPLFHPLLSLHSASNTPESSSRLHSRVFTSSFDLHQNVSGSVLSLFRMTTLQNSLYVTDCCFAPLPQRDTQLQHNQLPGSTVSLLRGFLVITTTGLSPVSRG